ncbi:MAG TPA: hypothetical protein VG963_32555 [Polyangiaceae bacterium]|nr:hypothetical protein [Polyangiaceae bacterium]
MKGRCADGLSCHLEPLMEGAGRCLLEPGRCRADLDCSVPVQRCRRFGAQLGVCQDSGL